ncbi:Endoplasmic reticulum junction formation protein lunapark [Aphelenchoides besseyi]|nr:Endoplasmic reticulum junction formation protein lunapark [Aphelenchoides besseyi]KAI6201124.1 Endoplasmic reticulum junction formation protein lunapark [Aphelenchoides besseyi]
MGSYLSKKRKPIDELEAIVFKLEQLSSRCGQIQKSRYNFMWWTAVLAFFVSSSFSAMVYASNNYDEPRIVYVIVAWIAVLLIFLGLKFITFRFCNFMLERHQRNIDDLKARKSEIIESVKENEKFKVAKSIIEKYGSPEDLAEMLPMNQSEMSEKRDVTLDGKRQQSPNITTTTAREDRTVNTISNGHQNDQTTASLQLESHRGAMNRAFFTPAIRRQPIRPFIQPSRTPIDKILDYIVGDGPSNRFALICQQCYVHNGMCLPEEFKSMAFICFNCGMYNPARNSNGLFTPKRSITHQYPVEAPSGPLIRTATNSDSSDSENTEEENKTERADTET